MYYRNSNGDIIQNFSFENYKGQRNSKNSIEGFSFFDNSKKYQIIKWLLFIVVLIVLVVIFIVIKSKKLKQNKQNFGFHFY